MKWVVPYKPLSGSLFPLIPIEIPGVSIVDALVDSGASVSLFEISIAKVLGLPVESGARQILGGAGGRIVAYRHEVPVRVAGRLLPLKVCFSYEYTPSVSLLGRDNFFRNFLVTFDESGQKTILEWSAAS